MAFSQDYNAHSFHKGALEVDPKEVQAAFQTLLQRQAPDLIGRSRMQDTPVPQDTSIHESALRGQWAFAYRLAKIARLRAARSRMRLPWKHRSVGLLRRLALLVMVATINASIFL